MRAFFTSTLLLTLGLLKLLWWCSALWIPGLFFFTWGTDNLAYAIGHTILVFLGMVLLTGINIALLAVLVTKD